MARQGGQARRTSTNFTVPNLASMASTERSSTRKVTSPLRSSVTELREASSTNPTVPLYSSTKKIAPSKRSSTPFVTTVKFKTVLEFFHLSSLRNATPEEAIFLHILFG